jgi:hypothetical protein
MEPKQVTEYMKAVGAGLQPLADQITGAGKMVYEFALKHNYAVAVEELVFFGGSVLASVGMAKFIQWRMKKQDPEDRRSDVNFEDNLPAIIFAIVGGIVCAIALCISIYDTLDAITRLIAPEWSTISDILSAIHPAGK